MDRQSGFELDRETKNPVVGRKSPPILLRQPSTGGVIRDYTKQNTLGRLLLYVANKVVQNSGNSSNIIQPVPKSNQ